MAFNDAASVREGACTDRHTQQQTSANKDCQTQLNKCPALVLVGMKRIKSMLQLQPAATRLQLHAASHGGTHAGMASAADACP
mmetsp:Transcript_43691/g.130972  ORF Transcript_43691/g.130972 Transcript_43691/m.130972 type:complete len:83 (+) Transcript_43691:884-1132(+)|eukprot:363917-Chlamydomonas_euryale.AAC.3